MPRPLGAVNAVWAGFYTYTKENWRDNVFLFSVLIMPLFHMILMVVYFQYADRADHIARAVVGSGLMGMWAAATFVTGYALVMERWYGTLELMITTPVPFRYVILGRCLSSTLLSFISLVVAMVGAKVIFGVEMEIRSLRLYTLTAVASTVAFTTLGMVISSLFILTRSASSVASTLLYPVYIVSGLVFPVTVLPQWLRPFSAASPLYWASEGINAAMSGDVPMVARSLTALIVMTAVFWVAARVSFAVIERRVRHVGSLGLH